MPDLSLRAIDWSDTMLRGLDWHPGGIVARGGAIADTEKFDPEYPWVGKGSFVLMRPMSALQRELNDSEILEIQSAIFDKLSQLSAHKIRVLKNGFSIDGGGNPVLKVELSMPYEQYQKSVEPYLQEWSGNPHSPESRLEALHNRQAHKDPVSQDKPVPTEEDVMPLTHAEQQRARGWIERAEQRYGTAGWKGFKG